jgi:type I site-specific restriction-modification system R (restriction) subunit
MLHTYTIVDAITDKNVLPFRIDYISTMKEQENIADARFGISTGKWLWHLRAHQ